MRDFPDPASHWNENDARHVVQTWRRSGESGPVFARRHRIHVKRLYWWRKRLGANGSRSRISLAPAAIVATDEVAAVIRAPGGVAIELASATPAQIAAIAIELAKPS